MRPTIALQAQHLSGLTGPAPAALSDSVLAQAVQVPLSPLQERIWFLDQLDPKRTAYNRAVGIQLSGRLNLGALESGLSELANRQEALRAVFPAENGRPKQLVTGRGQVALTLTDLSRCAEVEREPRALELVANEASRPYILAQPGLRALLLRLSETEHWLVLIVSEIVADERSLRLILGELPPLYGAAATGQLLPPAPYALPFSEVVTSVPEAAAEDRARQLEYWKRRLADSPALLDLPSDRARPAQGDYAGARCPLDLDDALTRELTHLAAELQCDLFAIFLAGLAGLLHRYTGAGDIVIGSVASLRSPATRHLVGPFENRLALRCDLSGDPDFSELVGRCKETIAEALANKALPFREVIAAVRPQISPSYTPLFQVFLSVQDEALPGGTAAGLNFDPFEIDTHTSRYDLSFKLVRHGSGFSGRVNYSTALFDAARVARMIQHLGVLLKSAAAEPRCRLSKLNLLPETESNQLLKEWTATQRPYDAGKTLADLFVEQTRRAPCAEALVCGTTRRTYAELYQRAVQVARCLKECGVARGSLVGVCLERSVDLVAALLGTILAGAAYVPLDPAYPAERLSFTAHDANVTVLLAQSNLKDLLPWSVAPGTLS